LGEQSTGSFESVRRAIALTEHVAAQDRAIQKASLSAIGAQSNPISTPLQSQPPEYN
jgi:hypothetical protein